MQSVLAKRRADNAKQAAANQIKEAEAAAREAIVLRELVAAAERRADEAERRAEECEKATSQVQADLLPTGCKRKMPPEEAEEADVPITSEESEMARLATLAQLSNYSVKRLKEILVERGLSSEGCVEKGDLIHRIRSTLLARTSTVGASSASARLGGMSISGSPVTGPATTGFSPRLSPLPASAGAAALPHMAPGMPMFPPGESEILDKALEFGRRLAGTPYGWWQGGPISRGAPSWAQEGPPPSFDVARSQLLNCTGLANLMRRVAGLEIPHRLVLGLFGREVPQHPDRPQDPYAGGTAAYRRYFSTVATRFGTSDPYRRGTLLGRGYRNKADQGHLAVLLGDGRRAPLLHSYSAKHLRDGGPGVVCDLSLDEACRRLPSLCRFEYAVAPEHWLLGRPAGGAASPRLWPRASPKASPAGEQHARRCANGHALHGRRRKDEGVCDGCSKYLSPGSEVLDCSLCDWFLCMECNRPQA